MTAKVKKTSWIYWLHIAIGLGLMLGFPMLQPIEPITEVGMWVAGILLGMVYLWSTVDSIWPSLLGLLVLALCSGYTGDVTGYAAVQKVFMGAVGSDIVLTVLLGMVLFGTIEYVGCTKYLAHFFMTRKIFTGRPYVFLLVIFFCSYIISGLIMGIASLLILWPFMAETLHEFGYEKEDKLSWVSVFGIYLGTTLGQPMLPFKGVTLAVTGAFTKTLGLTVDYGAYIIYNVSMSVLLMVAYLVFVRFVIRPDVSKMKDITPEQFKKNPPPPMNLQQKAMFLTCAVFVLALLAPGFMPKTWAITKILSSFGTNGVIILCIVVLSILPFEGGHIMDFKVVSKKAISWDIFFLVAAAMYVCNALSDDITGVKPFLVQTLQPLLGGKPDIIFVLILLAFALITTNFANNTGMAVVLMPVVAAFAEQYPNVPATAICMSIGMMVFVALLTPAASPYCAMMHAKKDAISFKQILLLGLPMCLIALLAYTFIGYPIAKILF